MMISTDDGVKFNCTFLTTELIFANYLLGTPLFYKLKKEKCLSFKVQQNDLNNVIIKSNNSGIALDQEKIEQYFKAMSLSGSEKENSEKLAAMWMYATQMASMSPQKSSMRKITPPPTRPIMLIPASTGGSSILTAPPPPPPPLLMAPPMGIQYRGMTLPYMRPPAGSLIYAAHPIASSAHGTYRIHKSTKSADINSQRRRRRAAAAGVGLPGGKRSSKMDANRRQRSKSEADIVDGQAFTYTGLDRVIADSFLARQEQSNAGSHIDYTSSSSASDTYGAGGNSSSGGGNRQAASRASSKTKIVCRDVMM